MPRLSSVSTIHEGLGRERNLQERRGSCGQENEEHPNHRAVCGLVYIHIYSYSLVTRQVSIGGRMSDGQQQPPRRPCSLVSSKREKCHSLHGKRGEDCVREELSEKRCLAELFCHREATNFYREPIRRGLGSCSALVERFAYPENELLLPEDISKGERERCREVVHTLANCMQRHNTSRFLTQPQFVNTTDQFTVQSTRQKDGKLQQRDSSSSSSSWRDILDGNGPR